MEFLASIGLHKSNILELNQLRYSTDQREKSSMFLVSEMMAHDSNLRRGAAARARGPAVPADARPGIAVWVIFHRDPVKYYRASRPAQAVF